MHVSLEIKSQLDNQPLNYVQPIFESSVIDGQHLLFLSVKRRRFKIPLCLEL